MQPLCFFRPRLLLAGCRGAGVIGEDPLEAAWGPQQRPWLHASPAAAELRSDEALEVTPEAVMRAGSATQLAAASSSSSPAHQQQRQQQQQAQYSSWAGAAAAQQLRGRRPGDDCDSWALDAPEQRGREVEAMLARLQSLPWRRVDVCFGDTPLPLLSHQHIQMQRWWMNWPGRSVVRHLGLQLQAMERLRQGGAPPAEVVSNLETAQKESHAP